MLIERPLMYFDVPTKNGRIYKKDDILPKIDELIDKKNKFGVCYGELNHNDNVHPELSLDIRLSNVSHTIEKIYEQDNVLYGQFKILKTDSGKFLLNNIKKFRTIP